MGMVYWVIQELRLADLAKTQYTRDDEGPYSRIKVVLFMDNGNTFCQVAKPSLLISATSAKIIPATSAKKNLRAHPATPSAPPFGVWRIEFSGKG